MVAETAYYQDGTKGTPSDAEDDPFLSLLRSRAIEARASQSIPRTQDDKQWPPRLSKPPSAEEFRQVIEQHTPVIIEGCMSDRPRLAKWKDTRYLEFCMGPNRKVVVAVTPDGRADDLISHPEHGRTVFALPLEEDMPFSELLDRLSKQVHGESDTIAYLQSQNSNLSVQEYGDLSPLLQDLEIQTPVGSQTHSRSDLGWATEAFGCAPEAINIWVGTSASRTSMHRDFYENLFTVVRGWKEFTVYPPSEGCFLCDDDEYPIYKYARDTNSSEQGKEELLLQRDNTLPPTRWIPIDPTQSKHSGRNAPYVHRDCNSSQEDGVAVRSHSDQTKYGYALPALQIRVHEGETLYLPSGWFHHVAQQQDQQLVSTDSSETIDRGLCLCINWWYEISDDMALSLEDMNLAIPAWLEDTNLTRPAWSGLLSI